MGDSDKVRKNSIKITPIGNQMLDMLEKGCTCESLKECKGASFAPLWGTCIYWLAKEWGPITLQNCKYKCVKDGKTWHTRDNSCLKCDDTGKTRDIQ